MNKTKKIIHTGFFAAIICICSLISIPTPIGMPITLQTFAVALSGYVLGARRAMVVILIYILIGSVGIPVFSGFGAGLSRLFGATGGFIFGFFALSFFCGIGKGKKKSYALFCGIIGLVNCHIVGSVYYSIITSTPVLTGFLTVSLPFAIKDILSVIFSEMLSRSLKSIIKK